MTHTLARAVGGLFINMQRKVRTHRRTSPHASGSPVPAAGLPPGQHPHQRQRPPQRARVQVQEGHLLPLDVCIPGQGRVPARRDQDPPRPPARVQLRLRARKAARGHPEQVRALAFPAPAWVDRACGVALWRTDRAYKDQYGDNFTSAIPTNVFGPYDN